MAIQQDPQQSGSMAGETPAVQLEVQDSVCKGRHTLVLRGELDMSSAPILETLIQRLCVDGIAGLVLDLNRLSFMDSTGLRAVLRGHEMCREYGCSFLVRPGSSAVRRLFDLTGALELLPVEINAEDA